jgi:predicted RNase H-like HicB family nuclease
MVASLEEKKRRALSEICEHSSDEDFAGLFHRPPRLSLDIAPDDDQYRAFCPELDLVTAADTREEAERDLMEMVQEYAEEYLENFELYAESLNRAAHRPHILAIATCESEEEVRSLFKR